MTGRDAWRRRARFFHEEDARILRFLIPPGSRVLQVGCGAGHVLDLLRPAEGVGIDVDAAAIAEGRRLFPHLKLHRAPLEGAAAWPVEGIFDVVLIVDALGAARDCQSLLQRLHRFCDDRTRLVVVSYSHLWDPLVKLAEAIGWKRPEGPQNVLAGADIAALAGLADFEPVKAEKRLLSPLRLLGLGRFFNRFVAPLPLVRELALRHYVVCRRTPRGPPPLSASVIVPARNERGNIAPAVARLPAFCGDIELIFVEGGSGDGTLAEMERVRDENSARDIKVLRQPGHGKADAVFAGFDAARGDVLMILDADLTVPPEELGKFWAAIASGKGEFVNGTRLVYPMEEGAMRFLNLVANRLFSLLFSWLLDQRYTDTLCGTKVISRRDYERLRAGRAYFGDFDPFGDFDLIFGAAKLGLKTVEVPIRYAARSYGETQISRFRHGWLLVRMVFFAFRRIKAL